MTHAARAHARFAPSSAHRWARCTGSVKLCENIPNKSTPAADEGTAAHMLSDWCLNTGMDPEDLKIPYRAVRDGVNVPIDDEMREGVQIYIDYVRAVMDLCEQFAIEAKLDLTHIHPEMFGTGDFIGYDEQNRRLHVVDFKYGRGEVNPEENYQGLAYALGAVQRFAGRGIDDIYITIVQPRLKPAIKTWTTDRAELRRFQDIFAKAAFEADNDPQFVAGEHCKYCPAAAICPTLRDHAHDVAKAEFGPQGMKLPEVTKMSPTELGKTLSEIELLEDWCKRIKQYAFDEACNGRVPPGMKLVAKRAVRKWTHSEDAIDYMRSHHLTEDDIWTKKLISPAAAEKLVSKDGKKQLSWWWEKVSSGIKLVSESDPGAPIAPEAASEFSKVEIEE